MMTVAELSLRGRAGGLTTWATHSRDELCAGLKRGQARRRERDVDPDDVLSASERARRVQAALSAKMAALTLRSAQVRRERKASKAGKTAGSERAA